MDPKTGELHFFGYSLDKKPYLTYSIADHTGILVNSVHIDIPHPVLVSLPACLNSLHAYTYICVGKNNPTSHDPIGRISQESQKVERKDHVLNHLFFPCHCIACDILNRIARECLDLFAGIKLSYAMMEVSYVQS